jgi:hypothetical protein
MTSPVYKSLMSDTPADKVKEKTLEFAEDKPIGKIMAQDDGMTQISGVAFVGADGTNLGSFIAASDGDGGSG